MKTITKLGSILLVGGSILGAGVLHAQSGTVPLTQLTLVEETAPAAVPVNEWHRGGGGYHRGYGEHRGGYYRGGYDSYNSYSSYDSYRGGYRCQKSSVSKNEVLPSPKVSLN